MDRALAARPEVRLVCVDVDGTISERFERPVPGAAAALSAVRGRVSLRLVTNATSRSHAELAALLLAQGLLAEPGELVTPATAARRVLVERGHDSGILIADRAVRDDLAWFHEDPNGPAVLLATEAHDRSIAELQPAFRRLLDGAALYALQQNRYYRAGERLVTDLGPVAAFLAYASGREVRNLGKPSRELFEGLAAGHGCRLEELVMVGDDAEFDASASVALGMRGVLVRTGKYRSGDENRVSPAPTAVIDSVADLALWLDGQRG
jgi:HAD superfamily hydrolase (TIGR01458 family)